MYGVKKEVIIYTDEFNYCPLCGSEITFFSEKEIICSDCTVYPVSDTTFEEQENEKDALNTEYNVLMVELEEAKRKILELETNAEKILIEENEDYRNFVLYYDDWKNEIKKPKLIVYVSDLMFYDGTSKNGIYEVIEETKNQYVIPNDLGGTSVLDKDKFKDLHVTWNHKEA